MNLRDRMILELTDQERMLATIIHKAKCNRSNCPDHRLSVWDIDAARNAIEYLKHDGRQTG